MIIVSIINNCGAVLYKLKLLLVLNLYCSTVPLVGSWLVNVSVSELMNIHRAGRCSRSDGKSNPFTGRKFTNSPGSPSKLWFGTGSTRLRLLRGNRTSHAHNLDLCKGLLKMQLKCSPERECNYTNRLMGHYWHIYHVLGPSLA